MANPAAATDGHQALWRRVYARLRETDSTVAAGSFLPLRGRVACTLLELAQDFGQDVGAGRIVIRQKIGQSDLAAMAGIARENVSRILNDLPLLAVLFWPLTKPPDDLVCATLSVAEQFGHLGDIAGNPSRLIAREQLGCRSSPRLIL